MCLMHGCPQASSERAVYGRAKPPTAAEAAPRATIDSHSRRPVIFVMLNGSSRHEGRRSPRASQSDAASINQGRPALNEIFISTRPKTRVLDGVSSHETAL